MATFTIDIDDQLLAELKRSAAARGITVEQIAAEIVGDTLKRERLLRPIREAFIAGEMTEDDARSARGDTF